MKESAYHEKPPAENTEREGVLSEKSIKDFIESRNNLINSGIINSGHNGIILRFLESDLPPEIQKTIQFDREENPEGSLNIKALKIYSRGDAGKEFSALRHARRIVTENENGSAPFAHVPKSHASYDLEISEDFQNFLNESGAALTDRRVGVVVMDYIEGIDLATLLYREALLRTYKEGDLYTPDDLDHISFNDLHRLLGDKLHFAKPGGKSRDENERRYEEEKVKNENAERLFAALEEKGFVLPPAILEQLQNTIEAFHKDHFFHNDLHERQIILKDGDLEDPKTFIIDYGMASNQYPNAEPGKKTMDDEAVVRRISRLTKTAEQREREHVEAKTSEWNDRIETLKRQSRFEGQYKSIRTAVEMDDVAALETQFLYSSSTDIEFKNFLATLIKLARKNEEWNARIIDFLSEHEYDTKKRPFIGAQIKQVKEILGG